MCVAMERALPAISFTWIAKDSLRSKCTPSHFRDASVLVGEIKCVEEPSLREMGGFSEVRLRVKCSKSDLSMSNVRPSEWAHVASSV